MVKCDRPDFISEVIQKKYYYGQYYCPQFDEDMYIYSSYYHEDYSMLNIEIVICNSTERELLGKTCASNSEINDFMSQNILSIITKSGRPTLSIPGNDLSKAHNKVKYNLIDLVYEVSQKDHATAHHRSIDYRVNLNKITTTDSRLTFMTDKEVVTTFTDVEKAIEFTYESGPNAGYSDEA